MKFCNHRWHASRIEVETLPVEHVCALERDHAEGHRCSCGAMTDEWTAEMWRRIYVAVWGDRHGRHEATAGVDGGRGDLRDVGAGELEGSG